MRPKSGVFVAVMAAIAIAAMSSHVRAVAIDLTNASAAAPSPIRMGSDTRPDGARITLDSISLMRDGTRWMPVMGEFHFSRYDQRQWRDELLKMKAGGIDVVSTYVFWIYHEEKEGQWDWSGQKSLHDFVKLCGQLGLDVIVRCGPWDHGECRNGGFPEWLLTKGYRLRSDDSGYLERVRQLYDQIGQQLTGLLWKNGGPVIGIQLENEFSDPRHLMTLKSIAVQAGIDVPLYTRTGWPGLSHPTPFGEIVPLFGCYGDGFWDRNLTPMPGNFWEAYIFSPDRLDTATEGDRLKHRSDRDILQYPFLTCELGGGMVPSYHRRLLMAPNDVVAIPLVKLGSGGQMLGYYMYHGGTHPDAEFSAEHLQETQSTSVTNYNDMPAKTYDFQAPLGEFGQIRPHYSLLRRLHLFLHDFGPQLAAMPAYFPSTQVSDKSDSQTLRWSVRSDGSSGYIFVSNYQRLMDVPAKLHTQFQLTMPGGELRVPTNPTTIPSNSSFFWPFNLDLGAAKLVYATAQPVCFVDDGDVRYMVFAQTAGTPSEFAFGPSAIVESSTGSVSQTADEVVVSNVQPGLGAAIQLRGGDGKKLAIVLLDDATSQTCYKARIAGAERILLSRAGLIVDGDTIRMNSADAADLSILMLPGPAAAVGAQDGLFRRFSLMAAPVPTVKVKFEKIQGAGPLRQISSGPRRDSVAEAPTDSDFAAAAVWHISLPENLDPQRKLLLRMRYVGDVARIYCGGKLLTDNFYNGAPFEVGVNQFGPDAYSKGFDLKILPLQKGAPIYLEDDVKPDFDGAQSIAEVDDITVVELQEATLGLN
jgi:hypothetical protein